MRSLHLGRTAAVAVRSRAGKNQWTLANTSSRAFKTSSTLSFATKKHAGEGNPVNEAGYGELGNVVVSTEELGKSLPGGRDLYRDVSVSILHGAKIGE